MFIVDCDRENVVNVDNVMNVRIDGKKIIAVTKTDDITIGAYTTDKRAKEVFIEMLRDVFPPSLLIVKNCDVDPEMQKFISGRNMTGVYVSDGTNKADVQMFNCGVYYMPEE